jgi:hypothetical protein
MGFGILFNGQKMATHVLRSSEAPLLGSCGTDLQMRPTNHAVGKKINQHGDPSFTQVSGDVWIFWPHMLAGEDSWWTYL